MTGFICLGLGLEDGQLAGSYAEKIERMMFNVVDGYERGTWTFHYVRVSRLGNCLNINRLEARELTIFSSIDHTQPVHLNKKASSTTSSTPSLITFLVKYRTFITKKFRMSGAAGTRVNGINGMSMTLMSATGGTMLEPNTQEFTHVKSCYSLSAPSTC